ncbi:MAG: hypothetical protein GQ529_06645 [Methyloprofundus sp.]|nr:hypothetical protein [Methyloprofundus sp.]
MKLLKTILLILATNLIACAEQEIQQVEVAPVWAVPCVFQNLQTAPSWVCDEPVSELEVQAVGMAEKSAAGLNYMQDMARNSALRHLAEKIKLKVGARVKQSIGAIEISGVEKADVIATRVKKTMTSKALENIKNYKSLIGPEGRIYVLVGLDKISTNALLEKSVKASINNE